MSIDSIKIKLRKKYYDGNMVRDAVMSVTDDYDTIMKLLKAFADQPLLFDVTEVVRCKDCKHFFRDDMGNVVVYRCELNHEDMRDDFYCADGEGRDDER